jgi:hypothetical protein
LFGFVDASSEIIAHANHIVALSASLLKLSLSFIEADTRPRSLQPPGGEFVFSG